MAAGAVLLVSAGICYLCYIENKKIVDEPVHNETELQQRLAVQLRTEKGPGKDGTEAVAILAELQKDGCIKQNLDGKWEVISAPTLRNRNEDADSGDIESRPNPTVMQVDPDN